MAQAPDVESPDILATALAGPKAIRGGMVRTIGYGAGLALALVSTPLLVRHLGVRDLGGYVAVLSLVTIVALVSDAGLTVVALREYAVRDAEGRRRLLSNVISLRFALSLAGAVAATLFALVAGYDSQLLLGTVLAGLGVVLLSVQQTLTVPMAADLRVGVITALDILRQALAVAGIVALVLAGAGVTAFLAVQVPVGAIVLVTTVLVLRGRVAIARFERGEWRYLLKQILPVAAASVLAALFYRIAIIMMSVIAKHEQTGYFAASFRVIEVIVPIPSLLVGVAFPILSRAAAGEDARLAYALQKLFEVAVILGAWTALMLVIGAEPIMAFLGGSQLDPAVDVLRLQGVAMAASFLVAVWAGGLYAVQAQRSLVIAAVVGVAAVSILTGILGPTHGATGAAISMTLSETLFATVCGVALMRGRPHLRVKTGVVWRTIVAVAAAGALVLTGLSPIAVVIAGTFVYFAVLGALGGIPADVWQALRRRELKAGA